MMQYDNEYRINSYSLHSCLIEFSEKIINSTKLVILKSLDEDVQVFYYNQLQFDYDNHDWFIDYKYGDDKD